MEREEGRDRTRERRREAKKTVIAKPSRALSRDGDEARVDEDYFSSREHSDVGVDDEEECDEDEDCECDEDGLPRYSIDDDEEIKRKRAIDRKVKGSNAFQKGIFSDEIGAHLSAQIQEFTFREGDIEGQTTTTTMKHYEAGTGGAFTGAKSGVNSKEEIQKVIAELTENTPAGRGERAKMEKQRLKQIEPNLRRWKETTAIEHENLEKQCDHEFRRLESERDLTHVWFHFDYDMFYAQSAIVKTPLLKDLPFVVGTPVCTTASYVARLFGIRSGMPTHVAMKLYSHSVNDKTRLEVEQTFRKNLIENYPDTEKRRKLLESISFKDLLVTNVDFKRYEEIAKLGHEIYAAYDANFLAPSTDEVYMNMTEYFKFYLKERSHLTVEEMFKEMSQTMEEIRKKIFEKTKLTVSGGCGPSLRLAKTCSDVNKPNGQKVLEFSSEAILDFLSTLSIRKIGGVGPSLERYLNVFDVRTCGDIILQRAKLAKVCHATAYTFLFSVAMGVGMEKLPRAIQDGAPGRRGVSMNRSWYPGISDRQKLFKIIQCFAEGVCIQCEELKLKPQTIMFVLKDASNFKQITRQGRLPSAHCKFEDWIVKLKMLFDAEMELCDKNGIRVDVRRLGVRASHFDGEEIERVGLDQSRMDQGFLLSPTIGRGVYKDLHEATYECKICENTIEEKERTSHTVACELHERERKKSKTKLMQQQQQHVTYHVDPKNDNDGGGTKKKKNFIQKKKKSKLNGPVVEGVKKKKKPVIAAIDRGKSNKKFGGRGQEKLI
jgi:DNA polymerase kappa